MKSIELYTQLITKIDEFEKKLLAVYSPHIRCARGCSACCILESVFPVEPWIMTRGGSLYALQAGKAADVFFWMAAYVQSTGAGL